MGKHDSDAIDTAGEVLNLKRDLWLFRTTYLPMLLRRAGSDAVGRWQRATQRLADTLPREAESRTAPLDAGPVLELLQAGDQDGGLLLTPPPTDSFTVVGDRVCWFVYPHSGEGATDREEHVRFVLRWAGAGDEQAPAPWLELRQVLPAVQEFFTALPPTSDKRMGGYASVLPILAELDPVFAAQALDRCRLVAAVEGDTALTPAERERQLSVLGSRFYAGCLCHGLALVLEALANNHFSQVMDFLRLPEIDADGYWNGLMPKVLLATLYRKAVVLRELKRHGEPGVGGHKRGTQR